MEIIKDAAGGLVMALFFGLFTWALIADYMEEYDLTSMKVTEGVVTEKSADKSLFTPPAYYVTVAGEKSGEESRNRILKMRFDRLEPGDRVKGFVTYQTFTTLEDLIQTSFFYVIGIVVLGGIAFCGFLLAVLSIPGVMYVLDKILPSGQSKGNGMGIVFSALTIFILLAGRAIYNLLNKLSPFLKTKKEALIIDEYQYTTFRKYEDSEYTFTLMFLDNDGNIIRVVKEVTANTFANYANGFSIPIAFNNANPYNVFIQHTTIADVFNAVTYMEMIMYIVLILVTVFILKVLINYKKSKRNHKHK